MRKVAPSADFERRDGSPGASPLVESMSGGFGSIAKEKFLWSSEAEESRSG